MLFRSDITGRGSWPNKSRHTTFHRCSILPMTGIPSIGIPSITFISCKWNVCVFERHRSTKAMIKAWSTSISGTLNNLVKPAASTYCMIRGSSPPYGNTHLRHRTFMTPGTSCTWMSIVLGSAHKVIIKQTHINNTTTYLIGSVPPKRSGPMIRLLGQLGLIVGSRLHSIKRLHI